MLPMFSLADSNFYYLSFFMNTDPGQIPVSYIALLDRGNVTYNHCENLHMYVEVLEYIMYYT